MDCSLVPAWSHFRDAHGTQIRSRIQRQCKRFKDASLNVPFGWNLATAFSLFYHSEPNGGEHFPKILLPGTYAFVCIRLSMWETFRAVFSNNSAGMQRCCWPLISLYIRPRRGVCIPNKKYVQTYKWKHGGKIQKQWIYVATILTLKGTCRHESNWRLVEI